MRKRLFARRLLLGPVTRALMGFENALYQGIGIHARIRSVLTRGTVNVGVMGTARSAESMSTKAHHARLAGKEEEAVQFEAWMKQLERWEAMAAKLGQKIGKQGYGLTTGGCGGFPGAVLGYNGADPLRKNSGFLCWRKSKWRQIAVGVRIGSLRFEQNAVGDLDHVLYAADFFARLAMLVRWSNGGVIIGPGGIGTRTEAWLWIQIVQVTKWQVPIVFLDREYFRLVREELEHMQAQGLYDADQLDGYVVFVDTVEEAMEVINRFNKRKPL